MQFFYDLVRASGYYEHLRAQKVRNYVSAAIQAAADEGTPFDPDVAAAIRRRVDLLDGEGGETFMALKNNQKVADFKSKLSAKAGADDLKFTDKELQTELQNPGEALAFDKYAGRVFQNWIDPKTGEKRTSSKINKLFRRGLDVGDRRTITGTDMLQRRNETREAAKARAEMDLNKGALRAVYSFCTGRDAITWKCKCERRPGRIRNSRTKHHLVIQSSKYTLRKPKQRHGQGYSHLTKRTQSSLSMIT